MHTDCPEVILAFEASLAFAAPILAPVAFLVHVSFDCCQGVERGVATLAVEFRAPVAVLIHMLTGGILCPIQVVSGLAPPMAYSVHVMLGGMPVTKCPVTSFAVDHINCGAARFEKKGT